MERTPTVRQPTRRSNLALGVLLLLLPACVSAEMASSPLAADTMPAQDAQAREEPAKKPLKPKSEESFQPARHQPPAEGEAQAEEEVEIPEGEGPVNVAGFGVNRPSRVEPPEGTEWLVDERDRRYFLQEVSKEEQWAWIDEEKTRVRVGRVGSYEVAEELEGAFLVKIYDPTQGSGVMIRHEPATEEEIAAVAATYETDIASADRLRLVPFDAGLPQRGQWRNGFALADMNGDGHLDIVHGAPRKGAGPGPVIFLGDGAGNWRQWPIRLPSIRYSYGDADVGDLDGDGHLDLVLGLHLQGLVAMRGDGEGNFSLWSEGLPYELPGMGSDATGFSSREVRLVDWNGDGRLDLLAFGEGPRPAREGPHRSEGILPSSSFGVAVFLNGGDGTWEQYDQGLEIDQNFGDSIDLGDFNGDGKIDFATSSNAFGYDKLINLNGEGNSWRPQELPLARPRAYTRAVEVADVDADGHPDLLVSSVSQQADRWWAAIDVFYSRPGGEWERRTVDAREGLEVWARKLATGDLDGDGAVDLVALTDDGDTWVFLGDGAGFFHREESPEVPQAQGGCSGYHVALADLDGDGRDEIVSGFAGEPSAYFAPQRCQSFGALYAWDAQPVTPGGA